MWNIYLERGTVWSVKSINQYEEHYEGMSAGSGYVLILSAFTDEFQRQKFTYLKVKPIQYGERSFYRIKVNDNYMYVELDTLHTGDQRSLNNYIATISIEDLNNVINAAKNHFNLNIKKERIIKPKKEEIEIPQQRIYKFGINVYVTENENVKVNSKKQIILSKEAKDDIIYNSKTDDQIRILCDKYKIYPLKAIKEIRNRLVYQHKQNEG